VCAQGGNAQSAAYSLQSLVAKTQQQIVLQAAGLAKQTKAAEQKNPEVRLDRTERQHGFSSPQQFVCQQYPEHL
jgi:hypothetical protein